MKKIILLFIGAIASFLVLAYIDQYENLVQPLFSPRREPAPLSGSEATVKKIISDFNNALTKAYLYSDSSLLASSPVNDSLRSSLTEEIDYLRREGRVMDLRIKDSEIKKVEFLSPQVMRVSAREMLELRYRNIDSGEETAYPDTQYDMAYTLSWTNGAWKIVSYEAKGFELK